jgi:hypothetical protein
MKLAHVETALRSDRRSLIPLQREASASKRPDRLSLLRCDGSIRPEAGAKLVQTRSESWKAERRQPIGLAALFWLRGQGLNLAWSPGWEEGPQPLSGAARLHVMSLTIAMAPRRRRTPLRGDEGTRADSTAPPRAGPRGRPGPAGSGPGRGAGRRPAWRPHRRHR